MMPPNGREGAQAAAAKTPALSYQQYGSFCTCPSCGTAAFCAPEYQAEKIENHPNAGVIEQLQVAVAPDQSLLNQRSVIGAAFC